MSFTANITGGSYKHNHIYGIKVNEYYSATSNLRVRKSDGSWQDGIKDGKGHAFTCNNHKVTRHICVSIPFVDVHIYSW